MVVAAVASDTCAYYAGCLWGSHKIWPRVSPKKSWEGAIGGLAGCVAATALLAWCFFGFSRPGGNPAAYTAAWIAVGVLLNVAAQAVDFFESALKRSRNVKDSSALLPGHGGLLDRMDSLLFVLPAYYLAKMFLAACLPAPLIP